MNQTEEKLIKARVKLLWDYPFWAALALRLQLIDASKNIPTCATDGRNFYYNADFVDKLSIEELVFVFGHEVEHCIYDHVSRSRLGYRNPQLWNMANDYVVNLELAEAGVGKMPVKCQGLYDKKYANMTSEEVYEKLLQDPNIKIIKFDEHLEGVSPDGQQLSEEEIKAIRKEIQGALLQAARDNADNCPNSIKRMLRLLTSPQMDWRQMLQAKIQSCVKNDFTWMKRSRKSASTEFYLPGSNDDFKISACCAIDTSGSMTEEMITDQLSEVKGIMQQFADFELHIWTFDTKVHNPVKFTPDNIDEINNYEVMGGGGTSFECNWKYMKNNDVNPEVMIMFTDGYNGDNTWGDENYTETIFVIHSNPDRSIVAPFGTTVYYEKSN